MYDWQLALGLELLAVVFGFMLWFMAAKAEGGPKKLAKVVAVVVVVVAVLLMACTITRAFMYAGEWKAGPAGEGPGCYKMYKMHKMGEWEEGMCPCCGSEMKEGHGPGIGMMKGEFPCPRMEERASAEPEPE